jgi:hypothetical protein
VGGLWQTGSLHLLSERDVAMRRVVWGLVALSLLARGARRTTAGFILDKSSRKKGGTRLRDIRSLTVATLAAVSFLASAPSAFAEFVGTISGVVTSAGPSVPDVSAEPPNNKVTGSYTYDARTNLLTDFSLLIGNNTPALTRSQLVTGAKRLPDFSTPTADSLDFTIQSPVLRDRFGATINVKQIPPPGPIPETYMVSDPPNSSFTFTFTATPVPEPSTLTMLGLGCVAVAGYGWLCRKRAIA